MNFRLSAMLRHAWVSQLLLAALVLRALLPAGYMPGVDANGLPMLQLCSVLQPLSQRLADADPRSLPDDGSRGYWNFHPYTQRSLSAELRCDF